MEKRSTTARVGIAALNLLAPGLGLIRLCRWKLALVLYSTTPVALGFLAAAPPLAFPVFATILTAGLLAYPITIGLSWHHSRYRAEPSPWHCRWYTVVAAALAAIGISYFLTDDARMAYRSFYTPADGMAPTLPKGDRFFAYMRSPDDLKRGDVVMVRTEEGHIYVKRIAALPGDRIGMTNGVVMLNGIPVAQRPVARELIDDSSGKIEVRRMAEQFPGESKPHEIYDLEESEFDNVAPVIVRNGRVFVLGDNRDRSADSRVSRDQSGLEQVSMTDVVGLALYHSLGSSRPVGTRIGRNR